MNKRKIAVIIIAFAVALVASLAVYAAGNYGSEEDPLVARSYLDSVLRPELEKELKNELSEALSEVGGGSGEFTVLALEPGQTLACEVGCEILPRFGRLLAFGASNPALVDTTAGSTVSSGAVLSANHLYMVSIAGNGITATEAATVLISGTYTVQ